MNRIINFTIMYVGLFIVELLIIFLLLVLINLFQYGADFYFIKGALRDTGLWNFWRILFYSMPFVLLYFLIYKYVEDIKLYKPLLYSFFNLLIYVLLSIFSRVIWGENVPLPPEGTMFWITCISIILSPLLLGQVPYFKKLMKRL